MEENKLNTQIAVSYARVSTNKEEQKESLIHQKEFFKEYVKRNNMILKEIYADATDIIGLKQNPTNGHRFSPIFSFIGHLSERFDEMLLQKQRRKTEYGRDKAFVGFK